MAARMALTRRASAARTIWRLGGGCGRTDIYIPAFVRARISRNRRALRMTRTMNPCIRGRVVIAKDVAEFREPAGVNWRFRVPEGEAVEFADLNLGRQRYGRRQ